MERAALAQYKLANLWQRRGEPARALHGYARAIALDSRCVPAHLEVGDLLLRQGERAAALEAYRRGLEANPQDASIATHLAHGLADEMNQMTEQIYIATASATADGRGGILLITDCGGMYGAAQVNQLLLEGLQTAGYPFLEMPKPLSTWLQRTVPAESATDSLRQVLEWTKPALVIFSDGNPLANLAAKELIRERDIPFFILVHSAVVESAHPEAQARITDLYRAARAVLTVSCANLEHLRRDFDLPERQGRVIYNGCPAIYFAPHDEAVRQRIRAELAIPDDAVLAFTAARMELAKGYQYQLAALKQLRARAIWSRLYVAWAGSGTAESQLRAQVMEQDMSDHVRFLGERMDVPALLDASDIFVLTSEHEGLPRAIIEAMAKGLPVAATNVGGVAEALDGTGQLLSNPTANPDATIRELVETLTRLSIEPSERETLGRAGRQRALEFFTAERMQNAYIAAIHAARR